MSAMIWTASISLALTAAASIDLYFGNRSVTALRDVKPDLPPSPPRVSIVVAARNEQRNIQEALQSLMCLDYPDYELIVVDDRSEDATGRILDGMAAGDARLHVLHIRTLPPGWLGKNHALWIGSQQAAGDLLLFTDADVVMEASMLGRAVTLMGRKGLDHLAATPSMIMPTHLLGMFGAAFIIFFSLFARPWKSRDPKSRRHIGIGAFNLIRKSVYLQTGGHETIRLRPDDDVKLGKIVKLAGFRQDVTFAPEFMAVEWYASMGEVIRGLEKNAFSGADYNIALVVTGVLVHSLCGIFPFLAVFLFSGTLQLLYLGAVTLILLTVADSARFHGSRPWYALGYPLMSVIFIYILLRTMFLNLIHGGIRWRGTFYPLKELKGNRV